MHKFLIEKIILYLLVFKYKCFELINDYNFLKKIFKKIFFQKKIIIKIGIDPNNNIIHLGHLNLLNRINYFEKFNFKIILILGNFTSLIGDPTDKNYYRICNFKYKICLNISYFLCQLKFFINLNHINIYYNNEWLDLLSIIDLINLFYLLTLNKILYRNDFKGRYNKNLPIFLPELIYPIFQSFDSIFIKSDIEIGGFDQKLNFLITKFIQKKINNNLQIILLLNLLVGLDGFYKMSKSKLNYISYNENFLDFYKNIIFSKNFYNYYKNFSFEKKIKFTNKKNSLINLIKIFFNNKFLNYILNNFIFIKIIKIKKKENIIYKLIKFFLFYSNNKIILYIKNNSLKINNILIKNFNFILIKGKYLLKLRKEMYLIFIL